MNEEQKHKFANDWLDSTLDRYSDAEPRPGYETRLLAMVTAKRHKEPRWKPVWTWAAVAATAIVIAVIALSVGRKSDLRTPPTATNDASPNSAGQVPQGKQAAPAPVVNASAERSNARATHRQRPPVMVASSKSRPSAVASPRQPQFPSPAPLSEQERLLLAYVRSTPKQEIDTVIAQKQAFQEEFDKLGVPQQQEKSDR